IPVKAALAMMGKMSEEVRLPLTPLAAEFRPALQEALQQAGVL
ncbi:MAG TPA: 4-hydroxy-tetrahydrodipicolinate synthase, partial [Nitrospiraceae bacterium]|nr:4-hydroxy-tetrahydrodipicolinate synthase [Nitrospiraceae bacterium]